MFFNRAAHSKNQRRRVQNKNDSWSSGEQYEKFMGRWSNLVAQKFLGWLAVQPNSTWLDVGCETGALTKLILQTCRPKKIISIDLSSEFILHAKQFITDPVVSFQVGSAEALEQETNSVDAVVSGIMLNFVPKPEEAVAEMLRVTKRGGTIGIFLWDYADGMRMLRYFWDAVVELNSKAKEFDEGLRFPLCREGQLEALVNKCGLKQVETIPIEVKTLFKNFDEYWIPFLGNVGPAPSYVMSLGENERQKLKNKLLETLPIEKDGTISLMARAWAVKGNA
jgi:ubiquinone/menaquinone biosynthesis C-methylase UbiE